MFSGDAHLSQVYPVVLQVLGVLMHFPLEAASKHVLAQVLLPALDNLICCFWKETLGRGKQVHGTCISHPGFYPWQTLLINHSTLYLTELG